MASTIHETVACHWKLTWPYIRGRIGKNAGGRGNNSRCGRIPANPAVEAATLIRIGGMKAKVG